MCGAHAIAPELVTGELPTPAKQCSSHHQSRRSSRLFLYPAANACNDLVAIRWLASRVVDPKSGPGTLFIAKILAERFGEARRKLRREAFHDFLDLVIAKEPQEHRAREQPGNFVALVVANEFREIR
jgi:hypothetical protein